MFKHCLSKFSCALIAMCALVTGGLFQSCTDEFDDYKYDDSEPSWLGSSIYDFLNEESGDRTYQNYVRIIEDLDLKDVLSRTGSKTLFIADDAAFDKFFADENKLGVWKDVKSYDDLTLAQKKVIFYNSMLDNAYLLDMMSSTAGSPPDEGRCMRRTTSASNLDTVPFFTDGAGTMNGFRLPRNNKFFDRYREVNGGKGIRLSVGASDPMMVHFLYEFVKNNNVEDSDFDIFFNHKKSRTGTEAFIYNNKILASGIDYGTLSDDTLTITCKNGYVYRMDSVLVPPSDMAQELRELPNTQLFSRMIDRFSYPLYSSSLTAEYNRLYHYGDADNDERIYTLKYAVEGANSFKDDDNVDQNFNGAKLPYDPGFAQYAGNSAKENNMAAMLVPDDQMVFNFFAPEDKLNPEVRDANNALPEDERRPYSVGAAIIERYANAEDVDNLDYNNVMTMAACLDSIPLNIVQAFVTNLMKSSFLATLPSNFDKVTNDARDPMGITPNDVTECVLANNGIIYILNNVFGPARYQAVMTPPLVLQNMRIINKVITDLGYESYLLAMDSYFSFIVPDDEYFVYYDPASLKSNQPTAWKFHYGREKASDKEDGVWVVKYEFDPATYQLKDSIGKENFVKESGKITEGSNMGNRLHDLMEYLIIVDDVEDGNQYYLTKGYGTVKCNVKGNPEDDNFEISFFGGEQLELQQAGLINEGVQVKQRFIEKNGITYCTFSEDPVYSSGVVSPPTQSVYSYMEKDNLGEGNFKNFFDLCNTVDDELLLKVFPNADQEIVQKDSLKKYAIYYNSVSKTEVSADRVVPFFSTYHYTVYAPTNEAVEAAYALGLPTREEIDAQLVEDEMNVADGKDAGLRIASVIRMINKLARYHFQDNAVYVDKKPFSVTSAGVTYDTVRYETAAIDDKTGRFFETIIKTDNGTISVKDNLGNVAYVQNKEGQEGKTWNLLTRDLLLKGGDAATATGISTSSFAVVQQIDKVLLNSGVIGFDGKFQRFALDGEPVEKMTVNGAEYLVGDNGVMEFKDYMRDANGNIVYVQQDTISVPQFETYFKNTAFIMKPKTSGLTKFSQEDYIFRADTAKILITEDGDLINEEGKFINWDGGLLGVDENGIVIAKDSIVKVDANGNPIK